ncbi:mechanosensitive ion channel protein [Azorhizobium oxalatiphilum]|uniref:Mechanosensitive ion channel protein n=2 Tax=Azorhizobium oxalatiphilum TaxID=980631 RepID=A0A917BQF5_9HYPH|nr:mechanosensitive ion channel protein [Azorhizobium oxalatiphilum]
MLVTVFLFLALPVWSAQAQQPEAPPANAAAADPLGELVKVMKDDRLRGELIRKLEEVQPGTAPAGGTPAAVPAAAPAAAPEKPADDGKAVLGNGGLVAGVISWLRDLGTRLPTAALGAPIDVKLDQAGDQIERRLSAPEVGDQLRDFGVRAVPGWLIITAVAFMTLLYIRRRIRTRVAKSATVGQVAREASIRGLLGLLPLVVCLSIAALWPQVLGLTRQSAVIFFSFTVPLAVGLSIAELLSCALVLLAPSKGWRIVAYAQRRLTPLAGLLAGVAVAGSLMALPELRSLIGPATADILSLVLDLAVPLIALHVIVSQRRTVRALIVKGHHASAEAAPWDRATQWLGAHWHQLGMVFVVMNIATRLFGTQGSGFIVQSFLSVALIVLALIVSAALSRFGERRNNRVRRPVRAATRVMVLDRLGNMGFRLVQFAIALVAVIACLQLWSVDVITWANSRAGASVVGPIVSIAIVSLAAWVLWVVLDAWISGVLTPADARHQRSARVMTLLPLLRNVAFVALSVLTVIGILSNLGINVAPLIAGAGVVGLAVGFGSQQLVQDVITGLFILLEDTLAIGDVVDTGGRSGTVEALTIRTVKIRDGDGALHSIPFSTIKALKNSSRGFGVYTAGVTLDVSADVERAIEVFKEVGDEVQKDTRFRGKIMAPLDVWGVDVVGLDGIVIKGAIKTLPLQQYGVGREINRLLKERLQAAGVRLASRVPALSGTAEAA